MHVYLRDRGKCRDCSFGMPHDCMRHSFRGACAYNGDKAARSPGPGLMKGDQESDAATTIRRKNRGAGIAAACQFAWRRAERQWLRRCTCMPGVRFLVLAVRLGVKKYGTCPYRTAFKPNSQQLTQCERRRSSVFTFHCIDANTKKRGKGWTDCKFVLIGSNRSKLLLQLRAKSTNKRR